MPKVSKNKSASTTKQQSMFPAQPWKCIHHRDYSEITAYVEASGQWEIVATIQTNAGASSEAIANFICGTVNNNQQNKNLLQEAMEALEICLEDEGLTFSSEQAADRVLTRIKTGAITKL